MNAMDPTVPVTRGELHLELSALDQKQSLALEFWGGALLSRIEQDDQKLDKRIDTTEQRLTARIDEVEQKLTVRIDEVEQKLTVRIDKLTVRIDGVEQKLTARIDEVEQKLTVRIDEVEQKLTARIDEVEQKLTVRIDEVEQRLSAELAHHARSLHEAMRAEFSVLDDKHASRWAQVSVDRPGANTIVQSSRASAPRPARTPARPRSPKRR